MSRPLRLEFPAAWYRVMNRGLARQAVFLDGLSDANGRFNQEIHAYCLMGNHYHLLVHTPTG